MENCEAMTSLPHSFAYSYRLVKKCFLKICETSKCHNFLIFQPIFIRFSLLCLKFFTLSCEIELNLLWSSSLRSLGKGVFFCRNQGFPMPEVGDIFFLLIDKWVQVKGNEHTCRYPLILGTVRPWLSGHIGTGAYPDKWFAGNERYA